jgi:hypothetical protein
MTLQFTPQRPCLDSSLEQCTLRISSFVFLHRRDLINVLVVLPDFYTRYPNDVLAERLRHSPTTIYVLSSCAFELSSTFAPSSAPRTSSSILVEPVSAKALKQLLQTTQRPRATRLIITSVSGPRLKNRTVDWFMKVVD